jgi:hypothetical protein
VRASREETARSLQGNWREELLFVLEQNLDLYVSTFAKLQYATSESSAI